MQVAFWSLFQVSLKARVEKIENKFVDVIGGGKYNQELVKSGKDKLWSFLARFLFLII